MNSTPPAHARVSDRITVHGIPVSLQILSWFFLNLLLVATFAFLLLSAEGGPLLNVLISGRAGERLDAIAADLAERVNGLPREKWGTILDNYSRRYRMAFALTRRDGDLQAGKVPPIPPTVAAKIREFPGTQRPPPPRRDTAEENVQIPESPNERPVEGAQRPPDAEQASQFPPPGPPPTDSPALSNFRFIVQENGLYWIGVRVPFPPVAGKFRGPTTLLLVSSSLFSNGILIDTAPLWFVGWVLLGSAVFWLPLVRRITVPLRKMRDAAELMARGQFDTRLNIQRGDEIGSLAGSLNHLGDRLEEFVSGQKRFLGDIAHELGSPLARMQFGLGIMEQQADPRTQPLLEDVREEVAQMSALLQEILQFTRAGLHTELHLENIDLQELLHKVVAQENIAPGQITHNLPHGLSAHGDAHLLQRALANILRNALRYAAHAGPIHVAGQTTTSHTLLTVSDNGPGVPPELLHRLCDPFFRTESARTRETGGVGLGLAIVKRCVEAGGGVLSIRNRTPSGLEVELRLPHAASLAGPASAEPTKPVGAAP
jgi:two-component system sensor histidine kinase CpxA